MTAIPAERHHLSAAQSAPEPRATSALGAAATPLSRRAVWAGRALGGLASAFLLFDAALKLFQAAPAVEVTTQLGYPPSAVFVIGLLEVACWVAYVVPRSAVLGAVLWTGYLGGAVATHVRVESPLFSHMLFPVYIGALLWAGLWLREPRLRSLLPILARGR